MSLMSGVPVSAISSGRDVRQRLRTVIPGAVVGAALWVGAAATLSARRAKSFSADCWSEDRAVFQANSERNTQTTRHSIPAASGT